MPKLLLNIFSAALRTVLLVIICIPQLTFANEQTSLPCIHYLKLISPQQDKPYIELYALSSAHPEQARKGLPRVTKMLLPDHSPLRQALYLLIQYNIEQAEGEDDAKPLGYISQLKDLGDETGIEWIKAEAAFLQAIEMVDKRQFEAAEVILADVVEKARKLGYHSLLARAIKWQGNIDIDHSEYKRGLQRYQQAYDLFIDCGDMLQVAHVLSNISTLYIKMEEWSKADHNIQRALEIYNKHNFSNAFSEAILNINASVVDKYLNRPKQRLWHIHQAVKLASKTSSYRVKLTTQMNLSSVYLDEGKLEEALEKAKACLELAQSLNDSLGIAYCSESIGEAYFKLGEFDQALQHAFNTLEGYEKFGVLSRHIYINRLIAEIYEAKGNFKLALKYHKYYADKNTAHLFDVRRRELFDLQEKFEAQIKEQQIALLKAENELKSARLAEQEARETSLRVGVMFVLFFLYWLYRRYSDVSRNNEALELSNAELTTQSMQDPLTRLYNRRYLQNWMKSATNQLTQSARLLVLLDIDHFKAINDQLGHDIGDQVLMLLAQRLSEITRCDDLVIRWGGEEFVLIINTCEGEAEKVLERLCVSVAEAPFSTIAGEITVTISIGAAFAKKPQALQQNWESMLGAADKALYQVKSAGRNGYQLSTSSS